MPVTLNYVSFTNESCSTAPQSATKDNNTRKPTSFLTLPRELRHAIFMHYFDERANISPNLAVRPRKLEKYLVEVLSRVHPELQEDVDYAVKEWIEEEEVLFQITWGWMEHCRRY